MSRRLTVNQDNKPIYDIVFENDFEKLTDELQAINLLNKKICIVTDSKVEPLYADAVMSVLKNKCKDVFVYAFPTGEQNKNLDTVQKIYEFLIKNKMERKDLLIALGGGVVGDVTGFVAATYLRGIDFVQIPTTLLAQVDSSVGGKTGVDFNQYKNMVGAFKMPRLVYMNLSVLDSLDNRQFAAGMGEVIKYGLIKNDDFYNWLINNVKKIKDRDFDAIEEMVIKSCDFKRAVVEVDPTEKGERALLNFGHTIGHAVEKSKDFKLLHGECVSLGSVAASFISCKKGYISQNEYLKVIDTLKFFDLPVSIDDIDIDAVLEFTTSDKKMEGNKIKFICLKEVGNAIIDTSVTKEELLMGIKNIVK